MKIILVGYMGAGKTTIGRGLANLENSKFVDTDKMISERENMSVPDFFHLHGEKKFREKEREVLIEVLNYDNVVISTGGGTPCFYDNMDLINKAGLSVYLEAHPKTLHERISYKPEKRPLFGELCGEELYWFIFEQLKQREIFYNTAQIKIKSENLKARTLKEQIDNFYKIR